MADKILKIIWETKTKVLPIKKDSLPNRLDAEKPGLHATHPKSFAAKPEPVLVESALIHPSAQFSGKEETVTPKVELREEGEGCKHSIDF